MTAVYWQAPKRLRVPASARRVEVAGWVWLLWSNKAGKWRGHVFAPLTDFPGAVFSPLIDRGLADLGYLHVAEIVGFSLADVLGEMSDRMGKAFSPDVAVRVRKELS